MKKFHYTVDQIPYNINVEGNTGWGKDEILLNQEENLIKYSTFNDVGYTVTEFLPTDLLTNLRTKIVNHLNKFITPITNKSYNLGNIDSYHKDVNDDQHYKIINQIYHSSGRGIPTKDIDFDFGLIEDRITKICNYPSNLTCRMPNNIEKEIYIRIVRPSSNKNDANPPHRDVWIDRLKNAVNIHFIIAGNSNKSTLAVLPNSHIINENKILRTLEGANINNIKYQVPSVVGIDNDMNLIRPRIFKDDLLVFSPYLIHGGGPNLNNKTRISLEMRFWKK